MSLCSVTTDELNSTEGREIVLGALDVHPISVVPPTSNIIGVETYTLG